MNIEVKRGDIVVSSDDPLATVEYAEVFARVLSENWLKGAPQTEPLYVTVEKEDGSEVTYKVEIIGIH